MRTSFLASSTLALIVFASGCDSCEEKKPQTTPTPSASAPVASASVAASASAAPSASAAAAASGNMAHCPTAVEGADTTITDVEGGVQLLVVAKDEKTTADIRARSKALLEAAKTQDPGKQHTGSGGGKGLFGHCTIIMHGTTLDVAEAPGGNKITVKAKEAKEVDWLRRETRERQATSHAEGSKGMGAHRMAHCPSAVTGATTKVTDTKDGVMVTVTGKGDDVVKDIRDRAAKLALASKYDAGKPEHTGEGHGGGGLGRCPVVLLDTSIEAKDVEGGSQLTVKADKKDGVAALQKESHDRAQVFAAAAGGDAGAAPAASGSAAPKK